MKKTAQLFLSALLLTTSYNAFANEVQKAAELKVTVKNIDNAAKIPASNAFCVATKTEKSSPTGKNISPEISWKNAPKETKSFALIMVDKDVPADFTDAGVEGKTIKKDAERQNFYHWGIANIPANVSKIAAGKGKDKTLGNAVINGYASFMKDKPAENFIGYDGPCPPFNDERVHNYYFQIYALNVEKIDLPENANVKQLEEAIADHIIAKGESVGTYSLYSHQVRK